MNDSDDVVFDPADEEAAFALADPSVNPGSQSLVAARDALSDPSTWTQPPASTRTALLESIAELSAEELATEELATEELATGQYASGDMDSPAPRHSWIQRWQTFGTVAAALALILGVFGAGWGIGSRATPPVDIEITMTATDLAPGASAYAQLTGTESGIEITLKATGLPPAGEGEYYQGWVKNQDGVGVTIGTFHMRGEGVDPVVLWSGFDLAEVTAITVTLQRVGDGPESSGDAVLKATIG